MVSVFVFTYFANLGATAKRAEQYLCLAVDALRNGRAGHPRIV